jgi:hypothetical protein
MVILGNRQLGLAPWSTGVRDRNDWVTNTTLSPFPPRSACDMFIT